MWAFDGILSLQKEMQEKVVEIFVFFSILHPYSWFFVTNAVNSFASSMKICLFKIDFIFQTKSAD